MLHNFVASSDAKKMLNLKNLDNLRKQLNVYQWCIAFHTTCSRLVEF